MARNAILAPLSLAFLAGSIVLLFFLILPGVANTVPLTKTYFLQAETDGITGARPITQWTYFYFCGEGNTDCGKARPAPSLGGAWNGDAENVPPRLDGNSGGTSKYFYLMWRFGWVFFIIALLGTVASFFAGFLACCGRLGAAISGFAGSVALFFHSIAVALMTAVFVEMRNGFQADGRAAHLGRPLHRHRAAVPGHAQGQGRRRGRGLVGSPLGAAPAQRAQPPELRHGRPPRQGGLRLDKT